MMKKAVSRIRSPSPPNPPPLSQQSYDQNAEDDAIHDDDDDVTLNDFQPDVTKAVRAGVVKSYPASCDSEKDELVPVLEMVFSFNTAGADGPLDPSDRQYLRNLIQSLNSQTMTKIFNLNASSVKTRLAIFAHGLCGRENYDRRGRQQTKNSYLKTVQNACSAIKYVDFTDDVNALTQFVEGAASQKVSSRGATSHCYELVLRRARRLSWTPGSRRVMVVVGCSPPHTGPHPGSEEVIHWEVESRCLAQMGVSVYTVQVKLHDFDDEFYRRVAEITEGCHVVLEQATNMCDVILALANHVAGADYLEEYEQELADGQPESFSDDLLQIFAALCAHAQNLTSLPDPATPLGSDFEDVDDTDDDYERDDGVCNGDDVYDDDVHCDDVDADDDVDDDDVDDDDVDYDDGVDNARLDNNKKGQQTPDRTKSQKSSSRLVGEAKSSDSCSRTFLGPENANGSMEESTEMQRHSSGRRLRSSSRRGPESSNSFSNDHSIPASMRVVQSSNRRLSSRSGPQSSDSFSNDHPLPDNARIEDSMEMQQHSSRTSSQRRTQSLDSTCIPHARPIALSHRYSLRSVSRPVFSYAKIQTVSNKTSSAARTSDDEVEGIKRKRKLKRGKDMVTEDEEVMHLNKRKRVMNQETNVSRQTRRGKTKKSKEIVVKEDKQLTHPNKGMPTLEGQVRRKKGKQVIHQTHRETRQNRGRKRKPSSHTIQTTEPKKHRKSTKQMTVSFYLPTSDSDVQERTSMTSSKCAENVTQNCDGRRRLLLKKSQTVSVPQKLARRASERSSSKVVEASTGGKGSNPTKLALRRGATQICGRGENGASPLDRLEIGGATSSRVYQIARADPEKREDVLPKVFTLSYLSWSPWKLIVSPDLPEEATDQWEQRTQNGYQAYYCTNIDENRADAPSLYEIALKPERIDLERVVLYKFVSGVTQNTVSTWESQLLGDREDVKQEVSEAVKRKCSIFLRRATFSEKSRLKAVLQAALSKYDYAWNENVQGFRRPLRRVSFM